jgi:hypothetical protein
MNAYWKYNLKYSKKLHLPKLQQPVQDLKYLTSGLLENNSQQKPKIGRSWKADELRLKSDSDLHKLWYVLIRERLALKSDQYLNSQDPSSAVNGNLIKYSLSKVQVSMSRLRGVVGERSHIRNEFMSFLEFYYIRKRQLNADYTLFTDKKVKVEVPELKKETKTPEGIKVERKIEKEKNKRVVRGALPLEEKTQGEVNTDTTIEKESKINADSVESISVLTEQEIQMVEKLKKKFSCKELIKQYVVNGHLLKDRQKRQMRAIIDAHRATQAKKIFMKEMAAVAYKAKSVKQSENPEIRKLENLS